MTDRGPGRRVRASMAAVITVVVFASGCSRWTGGDAGDGAPPPSIVPVPGTPPPPAPADEPTSRQPADEPTTTEPPLVLAEGPSAGCDQPIPAPLPTEIVTADGVRRTFRVALPTSYDPAVPAPLVFDFHGLGSEGFQQALVSGVAVAADRAGYIAVIPDGAQNELVGARLWNLTRAEDAGALAGLAVDDVAFTVELLDTLEAQLCVDTGRVFSMGLSNGGFFSSVLACELADRIAAVATVAGVTHPTDCDPVRPVPLLHVHGTADEIVPFDGGTSVLTEGSGRRPLGDEFAAELFQPIEGEIDQWAETNGCSMAPEVVDVSTRVEQRVFRDCVADVEFYVVEGGGHTWPGSLATAFIRSLGLTTFDVSATQLAFEWFDRHPMPTR